MQGLQVKDCMTTEVITVEPDTSLAEARRLMKDHRIRRLPVVDHGKLVGIVTWGDIREAQPSWASTLSIYEVHYRLAKTPVKDIMTRDPITVSPETSLPKAALMMLEYKIGALPVVEGKRVVGIITETDVLRAMVRELAA